MYKLFIFSLSLLSLVSCVNCNPNLSEKQLLALVNDSTRKAAETLPFVFPDTGYVPPVGAKYPEIRSVDPAHPPITLKVSTSAGAKQPLKLSMIGSSVKYVTLQLPDENDFFRTSTRTRNYFVDGWIRSSMKVNMFGDHFVTSDALGVRLFDPSGKFVQNLLMSESEDDQNFINKRAVLVDFSDTRCILTYIDFEGNFRNVHDLLIKGHSNAKFWAGEFDLANRPLYTAQTEIPTSGVDMVPVRNLPSGMYVNDNMRFLFQRIRNPIGITFNNMGDTLCKFTNYIRESGGAYNSDVSFFYRADGELYFRHEFSDTIFRVQSANRIVPAYRFDFGGLLVTPSEGATNKTQGKLIPWNWLVFKNSMLLIFTEGRDCPACRTAGELSFHCLLYDKQTGRHTAIDMKSRYPENALIENDIDGGLPIPLNSFHTQDDAIIATFTKIQIEEILKQNIPAETASKLKSLADVLKQNEMLVMVVR